MSVTKLHHVAIKLVSCVIVGLMLSLTSLSQAALPEVGESYYISHNLMFEKGKHVATNYWRGDMLPVNSKVIVKSIGRKKLTLSWKGQDITIINVPKHTKVTMDELGDRLLSANEVSLGSNFSKDIRFGELRLGMTKDQVIKTRGYPPAHKTISTEADRWTYWSSKFVQMSLIFEDGKLVQGRGLR